MIPTHVLSNELIFLFQTLFVSATTLAALYLGKEALVAFICLICVLANLFVLKQTTLFGLNATCADSFTIAATLGLNLLQEYYGPTIARKTITINFFLLLFYAVISRIHLIYIPSPADTSQTAFTLILGFMPRIAIASLTCYLISQYIDYLVYGFLKKKLVNRFLLIRNYGSMLISQLIDTILFSFLGLYGIVDSIGEIIVISYIIKVIAIALAAPFATLAKFLIKR